MSQKQQNLFDNSTKYFNLHEYIDRARTLPLLQEQLTYSTAGHLLETYVDALHVTLLADEQSFLIRLRDSPEKIRNPTFIRASHRAPPKYVIDALGNYLESPSFFVKHIVGEPGEPSRQDLKQPSATQFAHEVHGLLRQTGIKFTQKVTFNFYPPQGSGHELSKDNYHNLKRYNPEFAKKHFKEAATLIFAIERRLRATSKLMDATLYNSIGQLLNKAENLATKSNFSMIPQKLSNDIIAYLDLLENRDDISLLDKRALIPAMIAIKKSFILT